MFFHYDALNVIKCQGKGGYSSSVMATVSNWVDDPSEAGGVHLVGEKTLGDDDEAEEDVSNDVNDEEKEGDHEDSEGEDDKEDMKPPGEITLSFPEVSVEPATPQPENESHKNDEEKKKMAETADEDTATKTTDNQNSTTKEQDNVIVSIPHMHITVSID